MIFQKLQAKADKLATKEDEKLEKERRRYRTFQKYCFFLHNQHNILDYPVTETLRESIYDGDKYKVFLPYYLFRNSYLN